MAKILNIETATTACSVSITENGSLLAFRETNKGYTHAENLHVYIKEILNECLIKPQDLDAVAVSKGPGSYTGLRIGVSSAKGLCYALNIPLISVDTLQLMCVQVNKSLPETKVLCPMLDARRMEVYTGCYDHHLQPLTPVEALIVSAETAAKFKELGPVCFFGDGMLKCRELLSVLPGVQMVENIFPSSKDMHVLAERKFEEKEFENTAYFEPFYLKDFMFKNKKV